MKTYTFYLKKGGEDITRPISVKSHFDKFISDAIKIEDLKKLSKNIMNLIPQTTVTVEKDDQKENFTNCGERTLMNFFKYLLFDKEEGYITKENLDSFTENKSEMDWIQYIWEKSSEAIKEKNLTLPSFEEFWEKGYFELPSTKVEKIMFNDFRKDPINFPLNTPELISNFVI